MRKFLPILAALLALPGLASAVPGEIRGELKAFGWVKRPDGTRISLDGMKFPFVAKPIKTVQLSDRSTNPNSAGEALRQRLLGPLGNPGGNGVNRSGGKSGGPDALQTVYMANAGAGYGVIEANPSSLDDVTMTSAGLGKVWQQLTFGFQYSTGGFTPFICRWRCFGSNVENPTPQNDFADEFADFGVKWDVTIPAGSAFVVTIDIHQAVVISNDTTMFIAEQFREPHLVGFPPHEDGEGEFRTGNVDVVFNAGGEPSVGLSDNTFFYDWDPLDGKYENTEIDQVDTGKSDLVLGIEINTSGTLNDLTALNLTKEAGRQPVGNLLSVLNANDNNVYDILPDYTGGRTSPVGSIIVDFLQPFPTYTGIRAIGRVGSDVSGVDFAVDLWDFVDNKWIQLTTGPLPQGYLSFSEGYGGTVAMSHFTGIINFPLFGPNPGMRARVRYKNTSDTLPRNWHMLTDQIKLSVFTG